MAERQPRKDKKNELTFTKLPGGGAFLTGPTKPRGVRLLEGPLPKRVAKGIRSKQTLRFDFGDKKKRFRSRAIKK